MPARLRERMKKPRKTKQKKHCVPIHNCTHLVYELALTLSRARPAPGPPFSLALQSLG